MKAIINLATGRYIKGQERLKQTLDSVGYDGAFFGFNYEAQFGAPTHKSNPYAFKCWAIDYVRKQGYTKILWLDASVYAVKDVTPIFEHIQANGFIMQESGHNVGRWTNDIALSYFKVNRDDAMNMLMYGNAGFLGLDFESQLANQFFNAWFQAAKDGIFKGEWNNNNKTESHDDRCAGHRHDMCVGSIIANQLGMKYENGQEWLQYKAPNEPVLNETIILAAQGI